MNIFKEKFISSLKKTTKNYRTSGNISINEAKQIIATNRNTILIDVRSKQEYQETHIDGAICIPHYEIQARIEKEVPNKNTVVILYCQSGMRSRVAMDVLKRKGYTNVYHIKNGLDG